MTDFTKQLICELSKKYVFETFDFKNKSPEDLLLSYQEVFEKIEKVIEYQNAKSSEEINAVLSTITY